MQPPSPPHTRPYNTIQIENSLDESESYKDAALRPSKFRSFLSFLVRFPQYTTSDIEGRKGVDGYVDDDALGHGSHVAGSAAGAVFSGWKGPAECPGGVGDAMPDQTALSCVGKCLNPSVLSAMPKNNSFNLDAFCPEVTIFFF